MSDVLNQIEAALRGDSQSRSDEALDAAYVEIARLRKALTEIVDAKALAGVRGIVAGWNGENRPDGPFQRHPDKLGATMPKTTCGAMYVLDEALQVARRLVGGQQGD